MAVIPLLGEMSAEADKRVPVFGENSTPAQEIYRIRTTCGYPENLMFYAIGAGLRSDFRS